MSKSISSFAIQLGATLGLAGIIGSAIYMAADFATLGVVV